MSPKAFRRLRRRGSPPAKIRKGGGAAPLKTAKEPREKHRLEPYFNFGGRKNFNHRNFIFMKFDKKTLFIVLSVCYLLIGFFFWSNGRITGVPFPENLFTFLYLTLLWPLVIGMAIFYVVAIPAILGLIIALMLAVKKQYILATSLVLTFLFL